MSKIDIIIPAYKAHGTILRTLASVAQQTILPDLNVVIVNDACPEGDYSDMVRMWEPHMRIREIILPENGGPGVARQAGIDATHSPYFTCIDADDTFAGTIALETMLAGIEEPVNLGNGQFVQGGFKCASATFLQLGETLRQIVPHQQDMVWMFGKLYRRDFVGKYKIRFNETRANEDTGFNTIVKLLCDNPMEQVRYMPETVYYWHNKADSITRINSGQYAYDQCLCGWVDNMIYAIEHVRRAKPFSGAAARQTVGTLINLYFYWVETCARKPVFCAQNWEYIKKFYTLCYKPLEGMISDEIFAEMFSVASMEKNKSGSLVGFIPSVGIREFMDRLRAEEYNPDEIFAVWKHMEEDPETAKLLRNNEECGVCPQGYTNKPF